MTGMREAKNPNAKAPTKPRRLRRQADNYDACDGKSEAECNNEAMDGLECSAEDMLGNKNVVFGISSENLKQRDPRFLTPLSLYNTKLYGPYYLARIIPVVISIYPLGSLEVI